MCPEQVPLEPMGLACIQMLSGPSCSVLLSWLSSRVLMDREAFLSSVSLARVLFAPAQAMPRANPEFAPLLDLDLTC